jgi:hypothetical protein
MPEPRSEAVDVNVAVLPEAIPGKKALKDKKLFTQPHVDCAGLYKDTE